MNFREVQIGAFPACRDTDLVSVVLCDPQDFNDCYHALRGLHECRAARDNQLRRKTFRDNLREYPLPGPHMLLGLSPEPRVNLSLNQAQAQRYKNARFEKRALKGARSCVT